VGLVVAFIRYATSGNVSAITTRSRTIKRGIDMTDAMLEFIVKEVYGVSRYYPDNRKSRCIVNDLMQQKCLTATQVKSLNIVGGFNINIKTGELI
tara:strand:- start:1128 stop:1412 length:285 start_codon:yes stop_codon:yes gene_type:complete